MAQLLSVLIMTPHQVIYQDRAISVSSINDTGEFDVLDGHANFITLIKNWLVVRTPDNKEQRLQLTDGVMRVFQNEVKVFLGLRYEKKS